VHGAPIGGAGGSVDEPVHTVESPPLPVEVMQPEQEELPVLCEADEAAARVRRAPGVSILESVHAD
jgi:hypothetical protein